MRSKSLSAIADPESFTMGDDIPLKARMTPIERAARDWRHSSPPSLEIDEITTLDLLKEIESGDLSHRKLCAQSKTLILQPTYPAVDSTVKPSVLNHSNDEVMHRVLLQLENGAPHFALNPPCSAARNSPPVRAVAMRTLLRNIFKNTRNNSTALAAYCLYSLSDLDKLAPIDRSAIAYDLAARLAIVRGLPAVHLFKKVLHITEHFEEGQRARVLAEAVHHIHRLPQNFRTAVFDKILAFHQQRSSDKREAVVSDILFLQLDALPFADRPIRFHKLYKLIPLHQAGIQWQLKRRATLMTSSLDPHTQVDSLEHILGELRATGTPDEITKASILNTALTTLPKARPHGQFKMLLAIVQTAKHGVSSDYLKGMNYLKFLNVAFSHVQNLSREKQYPAFKMLWAEIGERGERRSLWVATRCLDFLYGKIQKRVLALCAADLLVEHNGGSRSFHELHSHRSIEDQLDILRPLSIEARSRLGLQ